jgi:hypothetical protein
MLAGAMRWLFFLALAACASATGYTRMVQGWVGKQQGALTDSWGVPSWIEPHGREGRVLVYHRRDGQLVMPPPGEHVVMAQGDWCETRFWLSAKGEITKASWQGPDCRA